MKNIKSRLLHDLIALCSGEIVGKIAGFIAFAYLARTLGTNMYGIIELAVASSMIFTLLINFGYDPIAAREVSKNPTQAKLIAAKVISARIILALFTIPIMGITGWLIADTTYASNLIWWYAFALIVMPLDHRWLFQGLEKMNLVALGKTLRMVVFAIAVFFLVHSGNDYWLVGVAELISTLLMATFFITMQYHHIGAVKFNFNIKPLLDLSKQALPIGLSNAVWAIGQYAPTLFVATLANTEQLAWFGASHRVAMSLIGFSLIYHFSLFPSVSKRIKQSNTAFKEFVYPSMKVVAWIGIGCVLIVLLGSEYLFDYIFGKGFSPAAGILNLLIWALPFTLLSGHARWALIAAGHQRYVFYAQTSGFVITLVACFFLVPEYHAKGGAIAMVFSTITVWTVAHLFAHHHIGRLPFIDAIIRPLLTLVGSLYIFSLFVNPWLAIASALLTYTLGALLIDWNLINSIQTIINIKDGESAQIEKTNDTRTYKQTILTTSLLIFFCAILLTPIAPIAKWLYPAATKTDTLLITTNFEWLKYFLGFDMIIAWYLTKSFYKHTPLKRKQPKPYNETCFTLLVTGVLLLTSLSLLIRHNHLQWFNYLPSFSHDFKINHNEAISLYIHNNQLWLFTLIKQFFVATTDHLNISVFLAHLLIHLSCIIAITFIIKHFFNAKLALAISVLAAIISYLTFTSEAIATSSIISLITLISSILILRQLNSGQWRFGLAYVLLIACSSWVYFSTIFIPLSHLIINVIASTKSKQHMNTLHQVFWLSLITGWASMHFYIPCLPQLTRIIFD